jgi:hypothetical protein
MASTLCRFKSSDLLSVGNLKTPVDNKDTLHYRIVGASTTQNLGKDAAVQDQTC